MAECMERPLQLTEKHQTNKLIASHFSVGFHTSETFRFSQRDTTFGATAASILVSSTRRSGRMAFFHRNRRGTRTSRQGYMWGNGKKTWPTGRSYEGEWRKDSKFVKTRRYMVH